MSHFVELYESIDTELIDPIRNVLVAMKLGSKLEQYKTINEYESSGMCITHMEIFI